MKRLMKHLLLFLFTLMPLAGQVPPRLSIDADGAVAATLRRGQPLFLRGLLSHSLRTPTADPIVLSPAVGAWADQIQLLVVDAAQKETSWPFMGLGKAEGSTLVLPPRGRVPMSWILASGETAKLELGSYRLRIVLAIAGSPGWNGTVRSSWVTIQVEDEPADLSEIDQRQLRLLRAREARAAGTIQGQLQSLNLLSAAAPQDVATLIALSRQFEMLEMPFIAEAYAEGALDAFLKGALPNQAPPPELPALLNRLRAKVEELEAAKADSAKAAEKRRE
ncbi:MAG: hypothetical protein JWP63_6134 [Candidatus Solibacter sp.]|nr:hypothetical protein [Candidatus Solibacter sp.]